MSQQQTEILVRSHLAVLIPRQWEGVQAKLLLACENPDFAKEAVYTRENSQGGAAQGLSIRFAEVAQALMRNITVDSTVESEDDFSIHYRLNVCDLEGNTTSSESFRVSKMVEKSGVDADDIILSERRNGRGESVYLVPATEDLVAARYGSIKSKVKRGLVLALIPADVRTKCLNRCLEVNAQLDSSDPGAAIKQLVAAFISIGVDTPDLKEYLGKPVTGATPAEIQVLREVLTMLRDGVTNWPTLLQRKQDAQRKASDKEAFLAKKRQDKGQGKAQTAATESAPARRVRKPKIPEQSAANVSAASPPSTPTPSAPNTGTSRRDEDEDEDEEAEDKK